MEANAEIQTSTSRMSCFEALFLRDQIKNSLGHHKHNIALSASFVHNSFSKLPLEFNPYYEHNLREDAAGSTVSTLQFSLTRFRYARQQRPSYPIK